LYADTPRDLSDYRTYISFAHVWNGIQVLRVFFSFLTPLTTAIGNFVALFHFWPITYLLYLSAFPPGHVPTSIDIICTVIHLYDLLLDVALLYLFATIAWPLLLWLYGAGTSFYVLATSMYAADAARASAMEANGRVIARKIAYTTDVNPGYRNFGDPAYFTTDPYTGARVRPGMRPSPLDPTQLDPQTRSTYDAQRSATVGSTPFDRGAVPRRYWSEHERANARFGAGYYDAGDGSLPMPRAPDGLSDARTRFASAGIDDDDGEGDQFYEDAEAVDRLAELEHRLGSASRLFGRPRRMRDPSALMQYERSHNVLLQNYSGSVLWMYQAENRSRQQRQKDRWSRPAAPVDRRGYTPFTGDPLYDASDSFARMAASLARVRESARQVAGAWQERQQRRRRAPPAAAPPPARPSPAPFDV